MSAVTKDCTSLLGALVYDGFQLWEVNSTTFAIVYQDEIIDFVTIRMPIDKLQLRCQKLIAKESKAT